MGKKSALLLVIPLLVSLQSGGSSAFASGSGVGVVPQGTQADSVYAASFGLSKATNVSATTQETSCYRPEDPYFASLGPNEGFSGMSACSRTPARQAAMPDFQRASRCW